MYRLEQRIPSEPAVDVLVAGGGMAGLCAAISAARLGARTLLLEGMGNLGGMGTSGLVTAWDGTADGVRMIAQGLMKEIVEITYAQGGFSPRVEPDHWQERLHMPLPFKPETAKRIFDEMVLNSGAEIRYFARVVAVDKSSDGKKLNGVIAHQVNGLRHIPASCVIDCTGDAHVAEMAGAAVEQAGRDTAQIMAPTLCALWSGTEPISEKPGKLLEEGIANGCFSEPDVVRYSQFNMAQLGPGLSVTNAGHVFFTDALDPASHTRAMIKGRRLAGEYESFMREHAPGLENIDLAATASLLGVRESRRIFGEYRLTKEDFQAQRKFHDQIGVHNKEVDIHNYEPTREAWDAFKSQQFGEGWLDREETYGLPYGILVPKGWHNLWVAGRCVSTDVFVHGSSRVMPAASMMGQAAGAAAAQALRTGQSAHRLDTATLVETLRDAGAYLPQKTLRPEMTRCKPSK